MATTSSSSTLYDEYFSIDYQAVRDENGYYRSLSGYNYSNLYFNEANFYHNTFARGRFELIRQLHSYTKYMAALYLMVIFSIKFYMVKRDKYDLRTPLILWNLGLAVFSIVGIVRVLPEFTHVLAEKGWDYSVCNNDIYYGVSGQWGYWFTLSKIPELFDTIFIVLRKRPLIFLHYYHHASILMYAFYSCQQLASTPRWFATMNFFVHSIMYSYYTLKAMRINVPNQFSMVITALQILQMVIGLFISIYVFYRKQFETLARPCSTTTDNAKYSLLMYMSYFILFFHFFYRAYIMKRPSERKQQQQHLSTPIKKDN